MGELSTAERRHLKYKEELLAGTVVVERSSGSTGPTPPVEGLGLSVEFAGALPVKYGSGWCDRGSPITLVVDDDGRPFLDLPMRTGLSGRCTLDIDDVWTLPLIRAPLLAALTRFAIGKSEHTARNAAWAAVGLARAIVVLGLTQSSPADLPADLFARMTETQEQRSGTPLTVGTMNSLNLARDLVGRIPGCAHVDVVREAVERPVPDVDAGGLSGDVDLERLLRECAARVTRVVREQTRLAAVLAGSPAEGDGDDERYELAAMLAGTYPAGPPKKASLTADLRRRIRNIGYRDICRLAWPCVEDMVAFATLVGVQTRYNPGILACLPLDAFSSEEAVDVEGCGDDGWVDDLGDVGAPVGDDRLVASRYKPRAKREQPVSFPDSDDPWGPAVLVDFVRSWTAPIRHHAGELAAYLFIYCRTTKAQNVSSFALQNGDNLRNALSTLSEDLGFAGKVRIKDLRPAGVDIIHEATGGDPLMIRAAGWWRDVVTGVRHYLGGPAKLRDEERLIWGLKIERRRMDWGIEVSGRPDGTDLFSATDGFRCGDPLRGPVMQEPGELCRARGLCPICPHADVDMAAPAWSCAQMAALADHLCEELAHGGRSDEWRARWGPVLADLLDLWIPLFPDAIVAAARRMPTIEIGSLCHD